MFKNTVIPEAPMFIPEFPPQGLLQYHSLFSIYLEFLHAQLSVVFK